MTVKRKPTLLQGGRSAEHPTNPLQRRDLDEFVKYYNTKNRPKRKATWSDGNPLRRWRSYDYAELGTRDKVSLDIFWLKDHSLENSGNPLAPGLIAAEIVEDLESALEPMRLAAEGLGEGESVDS